MENKTEILKGVIAYSFVPVLTAVLTLAVVPIVSNCYAPEDYAKISAFVSLGALFMSIFFLGLDSSLVRFYYEPPKGFTKTSLVSFSLFAALIIELLFTLFVLVFWHEITEALFGTSDIVPLVLLFFYTAGLIIFRSFNTADRMDGNVRSYNVHQVLQNLITKASFALGLFFSASYIPALIVMTCCMVFCACLLLVKDRRRIVLFSWRETKKSRRLLLCFGIPCLFSSIAILANNTVGRIILGAMGYFEAAGILSVGITMASTFSIFSQAFALYWSPYIYKNYRQKQDNIKAMHDYVMMATAFIVVLILLFQNILYSIVGVEYRSSQSYFMLIMLSPILALACETTCYGITIANKPKYLAIISLVGIGVSSIITYCFAASFGAVAAAIGIAFSALVTFAGKTIIGNHYYRTVSSPAKTIACILLIAVLCVCNSWIYSDLLAVMLTCALFTIGISLLYLAQIKAVSKQVFRKIRG